MSTILVVENGINTSYIDSLLIALFYKESHMQEILFQQTDNDFFIYLQELIYNNFVYPVRHGFSVLSSVMNEIRNYCYLCGWKNGYNLLELFNVSDYFDFLMNGFIKNIINIEILDINPIKNIQNINNITLNYINLQIINDSDIRILLKDWESSLIKTKNSYYSFKELPLILPIYLNRNISTDINYSKIDIKHKIKFYKNNDKKQSDFSWTIHSIICYSSSGTGSYYSLINMDTVWYMFNNINTPSITKIDIHNNDISYKIMQECVFLFYKLDN